MTDKPAAALAPSVANVLAALYRLGEATAAATAVEAGLAYSTTTPKLRTLASVGLAEPVRGDDGPARWRLTDTGRTQAAHATDAAGTTPPHTDSEAAPMPPDGRASTDSDTAAHDGVDDHADAPHRPEPDQAPVDPPDGQPIGAPAPPVPADALEPGEVAPQSPSAGEEPAAVPPEVKDLATQRDTTGGAPTGTPDQDATTEAEPAATATNRRGTGTLRAAVLDILEANPDQAYKVSELCKLIDRANEGTGAKKASAGAVHNAATKLVHAGAAVLAAEKPATFALARGDA